MTPTVFLPRVLMKSVNSMNVLFRKIDQFLHDVQLVDEVSTEDAEVVVIAYGTVARSAELAVKQARELGVKAGLLKLSTLFPYPRKATEKIMSKAHTLVVPEMNMGQMSREVKRVNNGQVSVRTINKVGRTNHYSG